MSTSGSKRGDGGGEPQQQARRSPSRPPSPPPAAALVAAAALPATVDALKALVQPHHRYVLIGEASHGTAEHYDLRGALSLALLSGEGVAGGPFKAIVFESDWPPAFAANLWARGLTHGTVADALAPYMRARFPTWLWANESFAAFLTRLRDLNAGLPPAARAGLYGLDVYSFDASMAALIEFYEARGDTAAAAAARARYACFADHGGGASDRYALSIARGAPGCEGAALAQLVDTVGRAAAEAEAEAADAERVAEGSDAAAAAALVEARERRFSAVCNARAVAAGEAYYRAMAAPPAWGGGGRRGGGRDTTWNLRDTAMALTVEAVAAHVSGGGSGGGGGGGGSGGGKKDARVIVWAHDSHLGRAGASEMSVRRGETNVGELLTAQHGDAVLVIGQLTHGGTVAAARAWGRPVEQRGVRPALPGSVEALFHTAVHAAGAPPAFALDLRRGVPGNEAVRAELAKPRRTRNIGVIYRSAPAWMEVPAHYQAACLAAPLVGEVGAGGGGEEDAYGLFDVAVFHDASHAVVPLAPVRPAHWDRVVHPDEADGGDEDED